MTTTGGDNVVPLFDWMFGTPPEPKRERAQGKPKPPPRRDGSATPYAQKAIDDECAQLRSTAAGGRNHALNRATFNLASIVAAGHADEQYVVDMLTDAARDIGLEDHEIEQTIKSGFRGSQAKVGARDIPDQPEIPPADILEDEPQPAAPPKRDTFTAIFEAEEDFWDSRDSLKQIKAAALSRFCSPWAVLGHCAARAIAGVRPNTVLPPIIGGPGSLNLFIAVCTQSGGGKGAASSVTRELVSNPVVERNAGSGEGMVQAFYRPGTKTREPEINESVMFHVDEVDTIAALNSRSGSTTAPMIRSAFSGETLGWSYKESNTIEAHTYRMTLVVSVQPARAGGLLSDAHGGTPQRFMWFPGTDPRISRQAAREAGPYIYPLNLPAPGEWQYPRVLKVPACVVDAVEEAAEKRGRGDVDALDGHALFCREKMAYSLAVIDGRTEMNEEDWRLSGIAAEISERTRAWVISEMQKSADDEAAERGRVMGITYAESDASKTQRNAERAGRVARWILERLEIGPQTKQDLSRAIPGRNRAWLHTSLESLEKAGHIVKETVESTGQRGPKTVERWSLA